MARSIRYALGYLVFLALAFYSVNARQVSQTTDHNVVISLPSDTKLPPGQHPVVVDLAGKKVPAQLKVADATSRTSSGSQTNSAPAGAQAANPNNTTPANANAPDSAPASPWTLMLGAILGTALLIGACVWIYFKVYVPRKQIKPYHEALALLRDERYEEALPLLTQVESKLPENLRSDARFFIAFAHFKLNNPKEAEHVLDALHREHPGDAQAAYLLAHVRVDTKQYDAAEPVLTLMEKNGQLNVHHAKKLFGLVQYQRALAAMKEGLIDGAAELFEKVVALGDFADKIPADLRNRHIALGTKALFDKDYQEARKQFETLEKAAPKESSEKRNEMLLTAKLGLALAAWVEDNAEAEKTVEPFLAEAAKLLAPADPLEKSWADVDKEKDLAEQFAELESEADLSPEQKQRKQNLRDIHFLRGMSVLRDCQRLSKSAALEQLYEYYERSLTRFACARHYDEQFSDVLLVVGLLMYYVHKPGAERGQAVDLLEGAQKRGMHEPNAMEIINKRAHIERANADAVDLYLQVLDKYLHDDTVRADVRRSLIERLGKYRKVSTLGQRVNVANMRRVEPTVAEMRNRSEILRVRVEQIISAQDNTDEVHKVRQLSETITHDGQKLYEQAMTIEKNESELLALTGTQLFKEQ